jgi:predicted  nucleic acid-binding Zn-ribbon protein
MEDLFLAAPDPAAMSDPEMEVKPQRLSELQAENAELRRLLAHSRTGLKRANEKADTDIREWQRRYESVMKNKFDALRRQMSGMGHNAQGYGPAAAALAAPSREEILSIHQELDRQRSQLRREEKDLHAQIRQEEVQLCKERAELSRLRSEWVRLNPDNAQPATGPAHQELAKLQQQLNREREQLKQDEQGLKEQIEQLERQVAHERAELARQRADWDRKQMELRSQLQMMSATEAALNEKLAPLALLKDKIEEVLAWRRPTGGTPS